MFTEVIGWTSALILLATISRQIYKQWEEKASEGISKWLFIGQVAASAGFAVYSWLLENWVFVVTNIVMLASALVGYGILMHNRRCAKRLETEH